MKRKVWLTVLSAVLAISVFVGITALAEEKSALPEAVAERATAINQRSDGWEEVTVVFDTFADTSLGSPGGVISQVAHYLELNGRPVAETLSAFGAEKVLASWNIDAYGKRTLNLTLSNTIDRSYLFNADGGGTLTGGDTLKVKAGLTLPEGSVTAEDVTFTYNLAARNWSSDAKTPAALNIVAEEVSAPGYVDFVFWFDYAPDPLIDNAFMNSLGGAYHDPNNNASPILFGSDNPYWGDNFQFVQFKGQALDPAHLQCWWYGNTTARRAFVLRFATITGGDFSAMIAEGDTLVFKAGFHTPEGVVLQNDVSFSFSVATNRFVPEADFSATVNSLTPVTKTENSPSAGVTWFSFNINVSAELSGKEGGIYANPGVLDHMVLNGTDCSAVGSGSAGPSIQIYANAGLSGSDGYTLNVNIFADGNPFIGLKLDGTDVLTFKQGMQLGDFYALEKDVTFYNYGEAFGNVWYGEAEKAEADAVTAAIAALTDESSLQDIAAAQDMYDALSEAQQSIVNGYETLEPLRVAAQNRADVAADKEALALGLFNGDTTGAVTGNILLPLAGVNGSTVTWQSSDEDIISLQGKVSRPRGIQAAEVTLTATIAKGEAQDTRVFTVTVLSVPYRATFLNEAGEEIDVVEQNSEGKFIAPAAPAKPGYTFAEWRLGDVAFDFSLEAVADVTLKPAYTRDEYKISYQLLGGTNAESNPSTYNVESETIVLADAQRTGYTFGGWFAEANYITEKESIPSGSTGNITLYAKWTAVEYKIEYVLGDGGVNGANPAIYTVESAVIVLQAPTRTGYTFGGWFTDAEYKNPVTEIPAGSTGDITLYAKWEQAQSGGEDGPGDAEENGGGCSGSAAASLGITAAALLSAACIFLYKKKD